MATRTVSLPKRPSPFLNPRFMWAGLVLAAICWALLTAGIFGQDVVNERGWRLMRRFFTAAMHPELSRDFLSLTLQAALETLSYAVLGLLLSLIIGIVGGLFSSEIWWGTISPNKRFTWLPWTCTRAFFTFPRAVHEVIWGLFFLNIFGLHPMTAIFAIGVHFGAITAKVFSEILDETPRDAFRIIKNSGASPLAALLYGIVVPATPNLLGYAFYRFECAIRSSAVLGVIGAGGLGYQIFLSLQSLRYEQIWTMLFALIALSAAADFWSSWLRRHLNSSVQMDDVSVRGFASGQRVDAHPTRRGSWPIRLSLLLALGLVVFAFWYLKIDFARLTDPRTQSLFTDIVNDSWPPRLDSDSIPELFRLSQQTLAMSILALAIASAGGLLLSMPAAHPGGQQSRWGVVVMIVTRGVLLVLRSVPAPIWALVLMFVLYPGILPGAIALGVYTLGILGRLLAETAENLDRRPQQSLKAGGASGPQVFLYGVLPRMMPQSLSYSLYRWEVTIRATVIVGLVGAGGLGRQLTEQLSAFDYRGVTATIVAFIILTFLVDIISALMRRGFR